MAGITIAGGSPPPILMEMYVSETMYEGQLVQQGQVVGTGAEAAVLDQAATEQEDGYGPIGVVTGVVNQRTEYDSTYKGGKCTYTTLSATMAADERRKDAGIVQVAVIQPMVTILRAPIYDGAFGTALSEGVEDGGSSYVTYQDATYTLTADTNDDYGTVYVRSGANRGLSRICTTYSHSTLTCTTTLKFPYANAVGDKFVFAAVARGWTDIQFGSTANYVEGDVAPNTTGFKVFVTKLDLSQKGQEFCEFMVGFLNHEHA